MKVKQNLGMTFHFTHVLCTVLCLTCLQKLDALEYCLTESFKARCPPGFVVLMTKAVFGRMKLGRCVTRNFGHDWCSTDVINRLDYVCSGKRMCEMSVSDYSLVRTKPCPKDFTSYLEAEYECVKVILPTVELCSSKINISGKSEGYIGNYKKVILKVTNSQPKQQYPIHQKLQSAKNSESDDKEKDGSFNTIKYSITKTNDSHSLKDNKKNFINISSDKNYSRNSNCHISFNLNWGESVTITLLDFSLKNRQGSNYNNDNLREDNAEEYVISSFEKKRENEIDDDSYFDLKNEKFENDQNSELSGINKNQMKNDENMKNGDITFANLSFSTIQNNINILNDIEENQKCHRKIATLIEPAMAFMKPLCSRHFPNWLREHHVHTSSTNQVTLVLYRTTFTKFLIKYKISGCPVLPHLSTLHVTLGTKGRIKAYCNSSGEMYYLFCDSTEWRGEVKECPPLAEKKSFLETYKDALGLPNIGLSLAIIVGVAMVTVVYVIIIMACIIHINRWCREKEKLRISTNKYTRNNASLENNNSENYPSIKALSNTPVKNNQHCHVETCSLKGNTYPHYPMYTTLVKPEIANSGNKFYQSTIHQTTFNTDIINNYSHEKNPKTKFTNANSCKVCCKKTKKRSGSVSTESKDVELCCCNDTFPLCHFVTKPEIDENTFNSFVEGSDSHNVYRSGGDKSFRSNKQHNDVCSYLLSDNNKYLSKNTLFINRSSIPNNNFCNDMVNSNQSNFSHLHHVTINNQSENIPDLTSQTTMD